VTTISVTLQDDDPEVLDTRIRLLREDVSGLDVDSVDFAPGPPAPQDAKGVDPETLGTIIVAVSGSPVLVQLGRVLRAFVERGRQRVVVREGDRRLEIQGPLDAAAKEAIESFFRPKELE
jgi:hypothetical protein